MTKKVIIFGAGISGLTTAHELLDKGFDVTIYEKTSDIKLNILLQWLIF